jgi:hypothetical protein
MTEPRYVISESQLEKVIGRDILMLREVRSQPLSSALKAEREKMLQELKDTCTQIDDNDQYYVWLEDVESVLLRDEP